MPDAPPNIQKYLGLPLSMREILALDLQRPWVLEPILGLGDRLMVVAPAKVGKTLLVTQIASHIVLGEPAFGYKTVPRRVLYIDFEMGLYTINDRLKKLARLFPDALQDLLYFQVRPRSVAAAIDAVGKAWRQWPEVLIVDPAIRLGYEDENNNAQVRKHLDQLSTYAEEMGGAAVILVHHAGKPVRATTSKEYEPIDMGRGASSFKDWMDTQFSLIGRVNDTRYILHTFSRISAPQDPLVLDRDPDTLLYTLVRGHETGAEALAQMLQQVRGELGPDATQSRVVEETAQRLRVSARTIYRKLKGGEDKV